MCSQLPCCARTFASFPAQLTLLLLVAPGVQRLAGREWPARVSACKLFATAYPPAQVGVAWLIDRCIRADCRQPLNCQQPGSTLVVCSSRTQFFLAALGCSSIISIVCRSKAGVSCGQPSSSCAMTRRPWSGEQRRRCACLLPASACPAGCLAVHCPWQPSPASTPSPICFAL